jgi:hypothetical protein
MKQLLVLLIIGAFSVTALLPARAAEAKPGERKEAATRAIPFRGKIASLDKQANTLKVGERTFQISSDTKIVKAGKPASLDEAAIGEDVGGSYREGADKKLNLVSLRIGAKPEDNK